MKKMVYSFLVSMLAFQIACSDKSNDLYGVEEDDPIVGTWISYSSIPSPEIGDNPCVIGAQITFFASGTFRKPLYFPDEDNHCQIIDDDQWAETGKWAYIKDDEYSFIYDGDKKGSPTHLKDSILTIEMTTNGKTQVDKFKKK